MYLIKINSSSCRKYNRIQYVFTQILTNKFVNILITVYFKVYTNVRVCDVRPPAQNVHLPLRDLNNISADAAPSADIVQSTGDVRGAASAQCQLMLHRAQLKEWVTRHRNINRAHLNWYCP